MVREGVELWIVADEGKNDKESQVVIVPIA
jgi:hypothetical protein